MTDTAAFIDLLLGLDLSKEQWEKVAPFIPQFTGHQGPAPDLTSILNPCQRLVWTALLGGDERLGHRVANMYHRRSFGVAWPWKTDRGEPYESEEE